MNKAKRLLAALLGTAVLAGSVIIPSAFAADTKDAVVPLGSFTVSSYGGANVSKVQQSALFANDYKDALVISSDTQKYGIIADLNKLTASVTGNGNVVTPLVSGNVFSVDSMVSVTEKANLSVTSEKGFSVAYNGSYSFSGSLTSSKAGGYVEYSRKQSLIGSEGIVFYLKTEGANLVNIELDVNDPENENRWTYSWDPWLMLKKGAAYSYMTLGGSSWKTASAVAREGSDIFGAMQFDTAFEGYVKIPYSSLTNDCGFVFDAKQDSFEKIIVRTKNIGGAAGNFAAGPFFVLNKNSDSGTVTVNTSEPSDSPTMLGGRAEGFELPLADTESVLLYVKTEAANRLGVTVEVADDYITQMPDLELTAGSKVSLLKKGSNKWSEAVVKATQTVGAVEFESAFEGYVKIPFDSFTAGNSSVAFLKEIDYAVGFEFALAGVGGKYGEVTVAPFLMTEDTDNTDFEISDTVSKPAYESIKVEPMAEGNYYSANGGSASTVKVVTPLEWINLDGIEMNAINETANTTAAHSMAASFGSYFTVNDSAASFFTSDTIILYVKTDSANDIAFKIYNQSWAEYFFKANTAYSCASLTDEFWSDALMKTATHNGTDYGVLSFDSAFEGYVKLNLPVNVGVSATGKFIYMYFYPKQLGGQYGKVTVGPVLCAENDSISTELTADKKYTSDAIKADPIPDWVISNPYWESVSATLTNPVDWTDLQGITLNVKENGAYAAPDTAVADTEWHFVDADISPNSAFGDETHLIFYVKTDAANALVPRISTKWGYLATPKLGATYHYLKKGDRGWSEATVTRSGADVAGSNYHGSFVFNEAFEGFIKIKISDLGHNDIGGIVSGNAFDDIYMNYKGIGGVYGDSLTVGPFFLVNKDSESAEILLPDEYMKDEGEEPGGEPPIQIEDDIDKPVAERFENVLKYSADGSRQGYWFAVGDSTRHHLGYPVYRLIAHKLENEYGIIPALISEEDLTAEKFAETKVDELIADIPGDGKGSIVDISLGLYDSADAATTAGYIASAIEKIRTARPYAVIVYTGQNLVMDETVNEKTAAVNKAVFEDERVFPVDVTGEAFDGYYTQYYTDDILPNTDGYRVIASYISSCYFGGEFEKVVTADAAAIALPEGATLVNTDYKTLHSIGIGSENGLIKVENEFAKTLVLSGKQAYSGKHPYDSGNEILFDLTKPVGGDNCIMFYLELPAANKIGLVAYKDNEKNVNEDFVMMLTNSEYDILPDGSADWETLKTVRGSDVEGQLPGALEFTSAFKGWVRIPYKAFGLTGSMSSGEGIRALIVRLSELGGAYGDVKIGTFATMTRPSYVASGVWKKSDLPEMVPFTDPVSITKYWEAFLEVTPSVTPTLTTEQGAWISCDPTIDKEGQDYMKSWFELYKNYDDMPIGEFTHLMFYVKVPETKENRLSICMFTDTNFEYKIMANQSYALLQLGETEWQHYLAEDVKLNNYGGIVLPAGFEGFIKVPMESLLPSTVDSATKLRQICFRFGYIGMNEEACLWGGTFGVTKDNDPGPGDMVLSALPAATTNRKLYAIEEGDIFPDKIMLYWQPLENAASYTVEAYTVDRVNKAYEYRLAASETFFTNSGTVTGLKMNTSYAILIKARDADGNLIATYEYVRTKTARENPYVMKGMSDELKLDTAGLPDGDTASETDNFPLVTVIIIAAAVLLGGGAAAAVILIKKRRKKNA